MFKKIKQIFSVPELRKSILFAILVLVVFRIAAHIPIPGVDSEALKRIFTQNQFLGLLNIFSGGGLENFSLVAMGVGPYITASIIVQLLGMVIPSLEEMQKEGEQSRAKLNQWTRVLAVPLAVIQSFSLISLLSRSSQQVIGALSPVQMAVTVITLTAGTMFLMWLGELISEKNIGNGISLIIFAGIISQLPQVFQQTALIFDQTQLVNLITFAAIGLVTIAVVIFITEGQRNIPVSYARAVRSSRVYGGTTTDLPLRVNPSGVIPIIFAISMILFPPVVAQFFLRARTVWLANFAQSVIDFFNNQLYYGIMYFVLVFFFTYFYTSVVFKPDQISENLQKQGGFIPGIRPGKPTSDYLNFVMNRIIPAGAVFLSVIAVLPLIMQRLTGLQTLVVGGTSLLIVVSVVIEMVAKIEAQLTVRDYDVL